ncbi:hypothetical protein CDAR_612111 [Caerostris darwini]|uniref:C2H2-type domain-containing protein n=1 Tax=Caerostris darwini TaxID=1538125 RepID=A0AAV4RY91_9ARAC|nr:hypothetical protein CDAR_612111 [Caerostris darwini]
MPSVYCGKKKHVKEIYCGEEDCYCNQYFVACENSDEDSCVDVVSDNSEHTHNTHEKDISFVCDVCNIKFSDADSLKSHQLSHVKAKGSVYNKRKHVKDIYCGEEDCNCYKQYNFVKCQNTDEDSYVDVVSDNSEHTHNTHEKDISFVCDICNIKFSDADSLRSHLFSHVKVKGSVYNKRKHVNDIYCGEEDCNCNKQDNFVACENSDEDSYVDVVSDNLEHTHNTHEKYISFVCDVCNIKFSDADSLKFHQLSHVKAKGYVCNICKRPFLYKHQLDEHYPSHTKIKPYVCGVCSDVFSAETSLKFHYRSHSKEEI